MIPNISTIVQEDIVKIAKFCAGKLPDRDAAKAYYSAIRTLAAFGMAYGVYVAVAALSKSPTGAFVGVVKGLALYAVSHDIFVMAKRTEDQQNVINRAIAIARSFFGQAKSALKDAWDAHQANGLVVRPLTDGTFYRPLWNAIFDEVL